MIMRTWRGAVRPVAAERYLEHQAGTGVREYRVTTVSFWTSMEAVRAFAGEDPEQAKFYPGDHEFLVEKDLHVDHFEVVSSDLDLAGMQSGA
jgi:heme-degrading monooxygenase HmoA